MIPALVPGSSVQSSGIPRVAANSPKTGMSFEGELNALDDTADEDLSQEALLLAAFPLPTKLSVSAENEDLSLIEGDELLLTDQNMELSALMVPINYQIRDVPNTTFEIPGEMEDMGSLPEMVSPLESNLDSTQILGKDLKAILHTNLKGLAAADGLQESKAPDSRFQVKPLELEKSERAAITINEQLGIKQSELLEEDTVGVTPKAMINPAQRFTSEMLHRTLKKHNKDEEAVALTPAEHLNMVEGADPEIDKMDSLKIQQTTLQNMRNTAGIPQSKSDGIPAGLASAFMATKESFVLKEEEAQASHEAIAEALSDVTLDAPLSSFKEHSIFSKVQGEKVVNGANSPQAALADTPFDVTQIVSKIKVQEGSQEITLDLKPEELGKMTMKIRQEGDRLTVEMKVANLEAKHMVESNFNELKNRFLGQDFAFDQMQFSVDIDSGARNYQQASGFEQDYTAAQQQERLSKEIPVSETIRRVRQGSRLSVYA
ncbi:flagellar hook-length control protein FliK [Deltaproteobacteria bacterium TL4]